MPPFTIEEKISGDEGSHGQNLKNEPITLALRTSMLRSMAAMMAQMQA